MSTELVKEVRNQTLWLTIDRPERRNALNGAVIRGLREAITQAGQDPQLRAIVLTGSGDKAFCAGADLQSGQSFAFDYSDPYVGFASLLRDAGPPFFP